MGDDQNETHGETALEGCVDDGLGSDLEIQILKFLKNKKCIFSKTCSTTNARPQVSL